jgi:hypothetical protein
MGFSIDDSHVTPPSLETTTPEGRASRLKLLRVWVEVGALVADYALRNCERYYVIQRFRLDDCFYSKTPEPNTQELHPISERCRRYCKASGISSGTKLVLGVFISGFNAENPFSAAPRKHYRCLEGAAQCLGNPWYYPIHRDD